MVQTTSFGGIDCGKDTLDFAVYPTGPCGQVPNTPAGHEELIAHLAQQGVEVVGVEASGGYERPVRDALRNAGLVVPVLDPARVRHFAKAVGQRAKTDAIDARIIARFVAQGQGTQGKPADPEREAIADLLRARRTVTGKRADLQKSMASLPDSIRDMIAPGLAGLQEIVARLEEEIAERVKASKALARTVQTLRSAPGLGWLTAVTTAVLMPELGRISGAQAAALLGVAPYPQDSGRKRGQRHIGGGREEARCALYMAALAAACRQKNGCLADFYARLIAKGKPPKVALTACMRKLIVRINAMLANDASWEEKPAPTKIA